MSETIGNFRIIPVPCRRDNYAYLIVGDLALWVVDPTEFEPVQHAIAAEQKPLQGILATHHHHDHVGGIAQLCSQHPGKDGAGPWVSGHTSDRGRIPHQTIFVDAPRGSFIDTGLRVADRVLEAAHIPGHTTGAIAWKIGDDIFTGDTLFSAGCGRLFEGSAQDMFESFKTLLSQPGATRLWFGHEYTEANLRFAESVDPGHRPYQDALDTFVIPSCPTTVERELEINIFARSANAQAFGELRARKDQS